MLFFIVTVALDISLTITWWATKQITTSAINAVSYLITPNESSSV